MFLISGIRRETYPVSLFDLDVRSRYSLTETLLSLAPRFLSLVACFCSVSHLYLPGLSSEHAAQLKPISVCCTTVCTLRLIPKVSLFADSSPTSNLPSPGTSQTILRL